MSDSGVGVDTDQARKLANAATPGRWSAADEHGDYPGASPAWCVSLMDGDRYRYDIAYIAHSNSHEEADAEFIAAARSLVPALLDEVDGLVGKLAEAEQEQRTLMLYGNHWHEQADKARAQLAKIRELAGTWLQSDERGWIASCGSAVAAVLGVPLEGGEGK